MKIKTVTTIAGVNTIHFDGYAPKYYWIKNLSDATLYVSANPNPVAGADNVSELSSKASAAIETDEGVIYILGAGKVEIHNTDNKLCPFEIPGTSSGGGTVTVDGALSDVSENPVQNKVVKAALDGKADIINPNLLINPDFRINQRGKTEYSTQGYAVDRWFVQSSDTYNLTISSKGLSVSKTADFTNLIQMIDLNDYPSLYGGTVTLSAKISNISGDVSIRVIQGVSLIVISGDARTDATNGHLTFTISDDRSNNILGCMISMDNINDQASCDIEWIKLELGSVATPFIPPEPATELLKCQRYFQAIGQYLLCAYPIGNGTNEYAVDKSEVVNPMRTRFTVQTESINGADNKYSMCTGSGWTDYDITPGNREIACISTNTIRFFFNLIDSPRVLAFKHIYLDAEIY